MTAFLCLVFLFFSSSTAKLTNESAVATLSESCQTNISCPAIVAPLCARVMKKNQTEAVKKSIFIVVVNKCEMQYMKCHQGVEAAIVSMKNCEAGHGKPISKPTGLLKKRMKRQADTLPKADNFMRHKPSRPTGRTTRFSKPTKTRPPKTRTTRDRDPPSVNVDVDINISNHNHVKDAPEYDTEMEELRSDEENGEGGNLDENGEGDDNNGADVIRDENGADIENAEGDENNGGDVLPDEKGGDSEDAAVIVKNDGVDKEDNIDPLQPGAWQDFTSECPTSCPSRDVMVCARCMHDVYRTFLSTCHLRMFACEQPDEKLQLVSRTACAASAPFLADLSESVKRVTAAGDDDAVLRFLYCRMKGLKGEKSRVAFEGTNAKCEIAAPA